MKPEIRLRSVLLTGSPRSFTASLFFSNVGPNLSGIISIAALALFLIPFGTAFPTMIPSLFYFHAFDSAVRKAPDDHERQDFFVEFADGHVVHRVVGVGFDEWGCPHRELERARR